LTSATCCGGKTTRSTRPRFIVQALQTLSAKSSSSPRDAVGRAVKTRGDVDVLHPLRGVEHDPRSLHHPKGQRHRRCAPLKLDTLVVGELDHMPTGPGHKHYFAAPRPAPLHNPQNLRMRPLAVVGLQAKQTTTTIMVLRGWLRERAGQPTDPLFPSRAGTPLSRDALEHRLNKHAATAAQRCPSLHDKRITAHVLRHTAAMRLLQAGVDTSVIALWLGHEQAETTQIYLHADLALKEQALARTKPPDTKPGRYRPPDTLLAFLEAL